MNETDTPQFKVGDFVQVDGRTLGQVSDVSLKGEQPRYRVRYVQQKELRGSGFWGGGSGPVFQGGYPKALSKPDDILFAAAAKLQAKLWELNRDAKAHASDIAALGRAREILKQSPETADKEDATRP